MAAELADPALDELELTGRSRSHVRDSDDLRCTLHPRAAEGLRALRAAAAAEGIDLEVVSSFRDFDRQRAIWNAKYRGERPLYDRRGEPLLHAGLAGPQLIEAILIWSALPGASRHHWGSDLDVVDRAAMPPGYVPKLLPEEYAAGGVFARLGSWLGANMARFGFFRPYQTYRGGVQPEPWHLSFAPVSVAALAALSPRVLQSALAAGSIEGAGEVLARLGELHDRYVARVDAAPAPALAFVPAGLRSPTTPS